MCEDTAGHYNNKNIAHIVLSFGVWPDVSEKIADVNQNHSNYFI